MNEKIRSKIAKLEALIASTTNEGEKLAAILARDRLLKKLRGHEKYQKTHHQRKSSHKKKKHKQRTYRNKSSKKSSTKDESDETIDPFFYEEAVCRRSKSDETNATDRQKDYIIALVNRAGLSCPKHILDYFLSRIGLRQASRILDILLERYGDPRNEPLTENQEYFLRHNRGFQLNDNLIYKLTISQASSIIEAIKIVQETF